MGSIVGALVAAVLLMLVGRIWKSRDFLGLALTLWIVFGFGAAALFRLEENIEVGRALMSGASAETIRGSLDADSQLTLGLYAAAAVVFCGLVFIAFAKPGRVIRTVPLDNPSDVKLEDALATVHALIEQRDNERMM